MKTVLFAWELGAGLGHIASLRRYAARLADHNVRMVAAVRKPEAAGTLAGLGVEILQAPRWPASASKPSASATLGDALAQDGLADPDGLKTLLGAWSDILKNVRPDLVVADYAPAAALVARGRVPLMIAGNGFTVPPSDVTRFPILQRSVDLVWDEMRLLTIVNGAGRTFGITPLDRLPQLFAADDYVVETFPLLDPHDLQRTIPVDGPAFDRAPIEKRADAEKILVYFSPGCPIRSDIVAALLPVARKVELYAPDLPLVHRARLKLAGATIHRNPINFADALASSRLAVHFGGSGLASLALAAGVPLFIFSLQIEQELNGLALERAKIGRLVRSHDPATPIEANVISEFLADASLAERAAAVGETYRELLRNLNPLASFESKSLKLLG